MKNALIIIFAGLLVFSCSRPRERKAAQLAVGRASDTTLPDSPAGIKKVTDSVTAFSAANDTIVPGKSIGNISVHEKSEDVIGELGKPDSSDAAMGKAMLKWFSKRSGKAADTLSHSIIIFTTANYGTPDETPRVKQIRITSPFFKTAAHIGCGSTIAFIKLLLPLVKKPTASYVDHAGNKVMIYEDGKDGINFEIDGSTKCTGITVCRPGVKAREIYAAEFGALDEP